MVVNNDCRTPGWLPRGTDQNELVNAKLEIHRLTQELQAAEAKGREAGLEDAAVLAEEACFAQERFFGYQPTEAVSELPAHIRALKAPAIGSQGTEKGRG